MARKRFVKVPSPKEARQHQRLLSILVIASLLVVILLFSVREQLAGKAFYSGREGTAGFADAGARLLVAGRSDTYSVLAHIGSAATNNFEFRITYDRRVAQCLPQPQPVFLGAVDLFGDPDAGFRCNHDFDVANNVGEIIVRRAFFDLSGNRYSGAVELGRVAFRGLIPGEANIRFDYLRVYDAQTGLEIPLTVQQPTEIQIVAGGACNAQELTECRTEQECESSTVGGYWQPATAQCLPSPRCSAANPDGCLSEQVCTSASLYWYNDRCHARQQGCVPGNLAACIPEECRVTGGYWYNNVCNALPESLSFRAKITAGDKDLSNLQVYMFLLGEKNSQQNVVLSSSLTSIPRLAAYSDYTTTVDTRESMNVRRKEIVVVDRPVSTSGATFASLRVPYAVHPRTNQPYVIENSQQCIMPTCGNNRVDAAEQCDDGNQANGDGCSAACLIEVNSVCDAVSMEVPAGKRIGEIKPVLTKADLQVLLADRSVVLPTGAYPYTQTFVLGNDSESGKITFTEDDDDITADFAVYRLSNHLANYTLSFNPPLLSTVSGNKLNDLLLAKIELLGETYTITRAERMARNNILLVLSRGTRTIQLQDEDITTNIITPGITINNVLTEGAKLWINGTDNNTHVNISSINIVMQAEDDYHVGIGQTLSRTIAAQNENKEVLLTTTWDVLFRSYNQQANTATIQIGKPCPPLTYSCTDSDQERDYAVRGQVSAFGVTYQDRCVGNNVLEGVCVGKRVGFESYACSNGCGNGVCVTMSGCSSSNKAACNAANCATLGQGVWDTTEAIPLCREGRCKGTVSQHAELCPGDRQSLTVDTPRTVVERCRGFGSCLYVCSSGFTLRNGDCVANEACADGEDNDDDGQIDCLDADCAGLDGPSGTLCCQQTADCRTGETCRGSQYTITGSNVTITHLPR